MDVVKKSFGRLLLGVVKSDNFDLFLFLGKKFEQKLSIILSYLALELG